MTGGKHATIPVFVPHFACKNDCVFCDQRKIAGTQKPPDDLDSFLSQAAEGLSGRFSSVDIAFFGGSFTGIDEPLMRRYLEAAKNTREKYSEITGIRLSTRPDYIDAHILSVLKEYGVTAIELGAQSMCDEVLEKAGRGHTVYDTLHASEMIKNAGFSLVLQTMTGLPGDTPAHDLETARKIVKIAPDAVRIYPCVVLRGTMLERMMNNGEYTPQTLDAAVAVCAELTEIYTQAGIDILRIGLHSSDLVKSGSVVAGPFHSAFGELCESEVIYRRMREKILENKVKNGVLALAAAPEDISKIIGQKRKNALRLEREFNIKLKLIPINGKEQGEKHEQA